MKISLNEIMDTYNVKLTPEGEFQCAVFKVNLTLAALFAVQIKVLNEKKTGRVLRIPIPSNRYTRYMCISGCEYLQEEGELRFYFSLYNKSHVVDHYIDVLSKDLSCDKYYLLSYENRWKSICFHLPDSMKHETLEELPIDRIGIFRILSNKASEISDELWNKNSKD